MLHAQNFLLNFLIAQQQGVTDQSVLLRMGLVGGMLPLPAGLLLTSMAAQAEATTPSAPSQITGSLTEARPDLIVVPNVEKWSFDKASGYLKEMSFQIERQDVRNTGENNGIVFEQSPTPNIKVNVGSTIILYVSKDITLAKEKNLDVA